MRAKAEGLLRKFQATSQVVKLRRNLQTGGSALLDIGGVNTEEDTVVEPQPVVTVVTNLFGHHATMLGAAGVLAQMGDYLIIFSGGIDEDIIKSSVIVYGDEILKMIAIEPVAMSGIVVIWKIVARAVKPRGATD